MLYISREHVHDRLDKAIAPAASCECGETVVFQTRDCYDDSITSEERPLGDRRDALENPATGPLYIHGAMPGDILKVEILKINLRDWGAMCSSFSYGAFAGRFKEQEAVIFDISHNKIHFDEKLTLDCAPMIGVIGTAPGGEGIDTATPGDHGGNMDCRKIAEGSVLYLPVAVPGALLSLGDLHARMGDGEVFICGLETAGEVCVRVDVQKDCHMPTPFLVTEDKVMTIQSADTVDEAGRKAVGLMEEYIREAAGLCKLKSGMLMSLAADMSICQIVDPKMTVRVELPREILEQYGWNSI